MRPKQIKLSDILRRHSGQRTVLGVAIPVLDKLITSIRDGHSEFAGCSEKEIIAGFRSLAAKYIKSDFHPTYVERRLGRAGFLEIVGDSYRFRSALLLGETLQTLEELVRDLRDSLKSASEKGKKVINELSDACRLPAASIDERFQLVNYYLRQLHGNRGEMFEVVSFAILREYFRSFGFQLQRFSTTYANDGGMDFVAANAIYQVSADESVQKLRRDLAKAPKTKRVLIRPTSTPELFDLSKKQVLELIDLQDLLSHFVAWLLARDSKHKEARHLQRILKIALQEFGREQQAQSA